VLTQAAAFLVALAVAWVLTPIVRDAAHGAGLFDEPEERKVHQMPIPRLGGVAMGAAFFVGVAAALVAARFVGDSLDLGSGSLTGTLVGVALIGGVGLLDDLQGTRARVKLLAQVVVALVAFALGLSIDRLDGPWGSIDLGAFSVVLTVFWIVAVINAINLIDGLDGLADGVAIIAMAAFFVMSIGLADQQPITLVLAAGAGGAFGFARYNLSPATIIMGDTGSMLLGFLLASIGIGVTQSPGGGVALLAPILALGLPLADMTWAALRRLASGHPLFQPDKRHIHHRLLARGLSVRAVVFVLWAVAAALGFVAVLLA
jgi:UDP-GlcNAc:undecaprenyl-phosphate GlcNAc-1-phosphate transferase